MSPILRSSSSGWSFPASTRPCQSDRAFSSPWSTNLCSTSLSITGISAFAITCAISPPIVPAPTTAALKTNMAPRLPERCATCAPAAGQLGAEPLERGAELCLHRPADEQQVDQRRKQRALTDLVLQLERYLNPIIGGRELHGLASLDRIVGHGYGLAAEWLVGHHLVVH